MDMSVCPPECKQEQRHLWKKIDSLVQSRKDCQAVMKNEQVEQWKIIDTNYKHWEAEMSLRVKTQTLIAVVGVVMTIVLALLGLSFHSLSGAMEKQLTSQDAIHSDVSTMQRAVDRMEVQLESVRKDVDEHARQTIRNSRVNKGG